MRYVIYWLITCIVFTVFFFMNNAHAAEQWLERSTRNGRIVLIKKACPYPELKKTYLAFHELNGEVHYGCWDEVNVGKGHALVSFLHGEFTTMVLDLYKEERK